MSTVALPSVMLQPRTFGLILGSTLLVAILAAWGIAPQDAGKPAPPGAPGAGGSAAPDAPSAPAAPSGPSRRGTTPQLNGLRLDPMTAGAGPQGLDGKATVLFSGQRWGAWRTVGGEESDWSIQEDGSVQVGSGNAVTARNFGDFQLHLEFLCPPIKGATGQAKANSGVYLHGLYEIQILDSYGLPTADDRCGAIYSKAAPFTNAAMPAGQWQTYDILFRAPRLGPDGAVIEKPRVTVLHNGVLIHNNAEIDGPTPGSLGETMVAEGPIMLQDHGDPIRFRNIWIRPG